MQNEFASSKNKETMHSSQGCSFLIKRIQPREKYGKAYDKCLVDGKPNNEYREQCYPDILDNEILCAGLIRFY